MIQLSPLAGALKKIFPDCRSITANLVYAATGKATTTILPARISSGLTVVALQKIS
jgi:hypothetical protein